MSDATNDEAVQVIAGTWGWLGKDAAQTIVDRLHAEGFVVVKQVG